VPIRFLSPFQIKLHFEQIAQDVAPALGVTSSNSEV
jgi:hypothetical protein